MSLQIPSISSATSLADIRNSKATADLQNSKLGDKAATIQKSARDFEAVLFAHWLDEAEQSFATVPGGDDENADPGKQQFQSIAMQAVATGITSHGHGLGIGQMVAKYLQKTIQEDPVKPHITKGLK